MERYIIGIILYTKQTYVVHYKYQYQKFAAILYCCRFRPISQNDYCRTDWLFVTIIYVREIQSNISNQNLAKPETCVQ